jgi:hypothetical protein
MFNLRHCKPSRECVHAHDLLCGVAMQPFQDAQKDHIKSAFV